MRVFERSYSILFGHSPKRIALYATSLFTIFAVLKGVQQPLAPLLYIGFGGTLFLIFLLVDRTVINPRRSYHIAVVSTLFVAFFDLIFQKPALSFSLVGATISATVLQSLKCKMPTYSLPLAVSSLVYYLMGEYYLLVVSLSYIAVLQIMRIMINKMARGLDAMCMFSSFIYAVFAEDDILENAFRELGKVEAVPLHIYTIGGRHVVVVSDFHPGPFRHIGGGMLVDYLNNEIEKMGYRFTFLHGVGSHERDPVTRDSVKRIVDAVKSALASMHNGSPPSGVRSVKLEIGDVRVVGFSIGTTPHLAIVSRVESASDDIPTWVSRRVDAGDYILVDAQNKFDGVVHWREEDVVSLSKGLKALHEANACRSFRIGVGKVYAQHLDPLGYEIGPAGISAIVNDCDGARGLLIVFDGNNLDSTLYQQLIKIYEARGYEVVEVVTTDTHRATGVGLGRGYRIVGERINHSRIIELVDKAVSEAEESLAPMPVAYKRVEVVAEVLGEEGFRKIQHAVRIYKKVGLVIAVTIFVIPSLLIALLA
jgi:putative membrane protein